MRFVQAALFLAAVILGCGAAILLAQTPATFRAGTQEVLVDAVVVDKKGNFQRDLTQKDFKILEDGKEQAITSFALGNAGGRSKHFIALVFENEYPGLREQVMRFVDRVASPDLYIAVFSTSNREMLLRQAFTTDAGRIKAALSAMEVSPEILPAGPNGARVLYGASWLPDRTGYSVIGRFDSVAQALAPVRGKKALILFSSPITQSRRAPDVFPDAEGGPLALRMNYRLIVAQVSMIEKLFDNFNAADVSVYAFENGKSPGASYGDFYDPPEETARDHGAFTDVIHDLAVFTGGKYTPPGDYDLTSYLSSVTAGQDDYYLLGYTPSLLSKTGCCTLK